MIRPDGASEGIPRHEDQESVVFTDDDGATSDTNGLDSWLAHEVEPGVDPAKSDFSEIWNSQLAITVADWSADKARVKNNLSNAQFLRWLDKERPPWGKARWISLNNGLDWNVFKALAVKYDLHPLAVEDVLHVFDRSARSKSDWYANHLFVRLLFWYIEHDLQESGSDSEDVDSVPHHTTPTSLATSQHGDEAAQQRIHRAFRHRLDKQKQQAASHHSPHLQPPHHHSSEDRQQRSYSVDPSTKQFRVSRRTGRASIHRPPLQHATSSSGRQRIKASLLAPRRTVSSSNITGKDTGSEENSYVNRVRNAFSISSAERQKKHQRDPGVRITSRDVEEDPFEAAHSGLEAAKEEFEEAMSEAEAEGESEATHYAARKVIKRLTQEYRLALERQQLSIFLTRDGTVISIFSKDGTEIIPSIVARLKSRDTLLRTSEDASMLVQALFDVCVDKSLEITDAFKRKLDLLEGTALVSPSVTTVRHLHVLSQQLAQVRRTIIPLSPLLISLRSFDDERAGFASSNSMANSLRPPSGVAASHGLQQSRFMPSGMSTVRGDSNRNAPTLSSAGFISTIAKIYLSDVLDHVESATSSLELFIGTATQLEDYIFNTLSFDQNQTMKQLTFITIVFLPLSFLTGYFGMNFETFPNVLDGSISYFWKIAVPVSVGIVAILAFPDLVKLARTIHRKGLHSRLVRVWPLCDITAGQKLSQ